MPHISSLSRYFFRLTVILVFGMIGVVLAEASALAQDGMPQEPQQCQDCHVDIAASWAEGAHARAYNNPDVFTSVWEDNGAPQECLACHTSGYKAYDGSFDHYGVTCEACHGETPPGHPQEPSGLSARLQEQVTQWQDSSDPGAVVQQDEPRLDPIVTVCADCHPTTFNEWQQSQHGSFQLGCVACHSPHPQKLRFVSAGPDVVPGDDVAAADGAPAGGSALCQNCHDTDDYEDDYVQYAHLQHAELGCESCHWFAADLGDQPADGAAAPEYDEQMLNHFKTGELVFTGHTGEVKNKSCLDCHRSLDVSALDGAAPDEAVDQQLHKAEVRIEELEAEVDTVKAQGSNTSALRLAQGLIFGLAVGGVVIFGVTSFVRRNQEVLDE